MTLTQTEPRIAPLEPPFDPELEATLRKWMPPGSGVPPLALFRTLAVHDELMSVINATGVPSEPWAARFPGR